MAIGLLLILGAAVGAVAVALYTRPRLRALRQQLAHERSTADEKLALVQELNTSWEERFREISAAALAQNNSSFLALAETKLSPLTTSLTHFERQTRELEQSRQDAYARLTRNVGVALTVIEQATPTLRQALTTLWL